MSTRSFLQIAVVTAALFAQAAFAADYAGRFEDGALALSINPQGGGYSGEVVLAQQHFPLQAAEQANQLSGRFTSAGTEFEFTAAFQGDLLVLNSGGKTYTLHRVGGELNPLEQPGNRMAPGAAGDSAALSHFDLVNSSQYGKALSRQFGAGATPRVALRSALDDLSHFFGAAPTVVGAYEDQKDHASVGVSFSGQLDGGPIKGFVSSKAVSQGSNVLVVYCRADAPAGEVGRLMKKPVATPPPVRKNDDGTVTEDDGFAIKDAAGQVPLQQYNFPDGTGSVGVAQGWTTNAQTIGSANIKGPAGQNILMGFGAEVITPDSQMIQMRNQLNANAARMGGQPMPPIQMLIAPCSPDPATTLKYLSQAINTFCQQHNLPTARIDRVVQVKKIAPMLQGATAALIIFDSTKFEQGQQTKLRSLIQFEYYFVGNSRDTWAFFSTQMSAPQETFRNDLPVMLAQTMSLKENAAVIQEKTRQALDAQNARFKAMQDANKKVTDAYEQQHRDWERNQKIVERSNANFDEVIRGYRTVEDTRTGERTEVDLGNVHRVVENLNTYDPGRYKEIPLADLVVGP